MSYLNILTNIVRIGLYCVLVSIMINIVGSASVCWSLSLEVPETAYQGDLVFGKTDPQAEIWLKDQPQVVGAEGHFVLPVPRLQKNDLLVNARLKNKSVSRTIRIWAYPWQTQRIDGLAKKYVSPTPAQQQRIVADNRRVRSVRDSHSYPVAFFIREGFRVPVKGPVSSPFGLNRILNGKPKRYHSGVDLAAPLGTPVRCPANGIVRLVDLDMFLMGKTLMIDHGLGITSIFIHLDSISVKTGDLLRQGDIIARVGKTGRATGPHLHWGVSVGPVAVDPIRLLNRKFSN